MKAGHLTQDPEYRNFETALVGRSAYGQSRHGRATNQRLTQTDLSAVLVCAGPMPCPVTLGKAE
jgi:hypothetical protein